MSIYRFVNWAPCSTLQCILLERKLNNESRSILFGFGIRLKLLKFLVVTKWTRIELKSVWQFEFGNSMRQLIQSYSSVGGSFANAVSIRLLHSILASDAILSNGCCILNSKRCSSYIRFHNFLGHSFDTVDGCCCCRCCYCLQYPSLPYHKAFVYILFGLQFYLLFVFAQCL